MAFAAMEIRAVIVFQEMNIVTPAKLLVSVTSAAAVVVAAMEARAMEFLLAVEPWKV